MRVELKNGRAVAPIVLPQDLPQGRYVIRVAALSGTAIATGVTTEYEVEASRELDWFGGV